MDIRYFLDTPGTYVHFIGCEGAGMKPLRQIFMELGFRTTGSDLTLKGHAAENLPDTDGAHLLVIYSSAVTEDNPEMVRAKELGASFLLRGMALGEIAKLFPAVISVTGSHGKTSVSGMITNILKKLGYDPGYLIGGKILTWENSGSAGNGKIFVCEADESDGSHTALHSTLAVVTNMEDDHVWNFESPECLIRNFQKFAKQGKKLLSPEIPALKEHPDHTIFHFTDEPRFHSFAEFSQIDLEMAVEAVVQLGYADREAAIEAAVSFPGVARRMQSHGRGCTFTLYEDYAHHPTELASSIRSFRKIFPDRRLKIVFQPHRYARLERYFDEFVQVLKQADGVFVTPVFAAWTSTGKVDSAALVKSIGPTAKLLSGSWEDMARSVREAVDYGDIVAVIGAGDVQKILAPLQNELFTYSDVGLIIPAGGSGERFGGNKLFAELDGQPVFIHTILTLLPNMKKMHRIFLPVPVSDRSTFETILKEYHLDSAVTVVNGGATRTESVQNALKVMPPEIRIVAVHDAARPFVTAADLENCVFACTKHGAAVSAQPQTDTTKEADENGFIVRTVPREHLWAVQTPQVFQRDLLETAYQKASKSTERFTDDAALVEAFTHTRVKLVRGLSMNMKITWPEDLLTAALLAEVLKKTTQKSSNS